MSNIVQHLFRFGFHTASPHPQSDYLGPKKASHGPCLLERHLLPLGHGFKARHPLRSIQVGETGWRRPSMGLEESELLGRFAAWNWKKRHRGDLHWGLKNGVFMYVGLGCDIG